MGLIGAFIYTLASFLAIFVVSTTQLIITNGFLQGLGMGLLIPVSYTSFNSYFTKKKVLYLSLCKASIGLITMVYPHFIKFTMSEYGFRGTLAILCGISAHSIFGALVMHPVKWHMVKQPKSCEKIVCKYLIIVMCNLIIRIYVQSVIGKPTRNYLLTVIKVKKKLNSTF